MNPENRNKIITVVFYLSSILIVFAINISGQFKSYHSPNLDLLSIFLVVIINVILLVINGILLLNKKPVKSSFLIHLSFTVFWILFYLIDKEFNFY